MQLIQQFAMKFVYQFNFSLVQLFHHKQKNNIIANKKNYYLLAEVIPM